jgi:hypothetical protein
MTSRKSLLLLPTLLLAACGGNGGGHDDGDGSVATNVAVVATRADDYSSGAISLVDTAAPYTTQNQLNATSSDIVVRADGDHYFVLRRSTGQIVRYEAATPTAPTYTYSTNDSGESGSNPYDLIVASPTKAYLLRYGSSTIWIVDPSATSEANFKTGEIDLSAYDADGVPEMSAGLIKDGRLYVAMQRLQTFAATQSGYVAVIDTSTDEEIDTGRGSGGLKGIELPVNDPVRLASLPDSDDILVLADGGFVNFATQYNGGVVRIAGDDDAPTLLLDDGDAETHPYGTLLDMAIVTEHRAYLIGSTGYTDTSNSLYRFDPDSDATVTPTAIADFANLDLGALAVDADGQLWIGRTAKSTPGLTVLGFSNGSETVNQALIDTVLAPINIDFGNAP